MRAAVSQCLEILLGRRNGDGGWGYRAGQSSWLEPTAYAALALDGQAESDQAMALLRSWQLPSGAWPAQAKTGEESWATALVLAVKCVRGEYDPGWRRGLDWLLQTKGNRAGPPTWLERLLRRKPLVEQDGTLDGWPWTPGAASWIEPTAQALRALKLSQARGGSDLLRTRMEMGQRLILDRQCKDGGWNYGNRRVLDADLESFPECTAMALIGLCGARGAQIERAVRRALDDWNAQPDGLAQALLRIALRMHGVSFEDRAVGVAQRTETTVLALALIGGPGGTWRIWKGGGR